MSWQYLGQGSVLQAMEIANLELVVPDGGRCKLQLDLTAGLPQSVIDEIKSQMDAQGIPGAKVYSGSPMLNVEWLKEVTSVSAHPHDKHTCYCPNCGYTMVVDAGVKCSERKCPVCSQRMRAEETGEYRNVAAVQVALIVVAIIAALVVAALIIGWRFYMDVSATAGPVAATTILIIAGAGIITLSILGFLAYQRSRS